MSKIPVIELRAVQRLLAQSFRKRDIEPRITSKMIQVFKHLGYVFTLKPNGELQQYWANELEDNFLIPSWSDLKNLKKGQKLSPTEFAQWLSLTPHEFPLSARKAFRDKKYERMAKRFRSAERAYAMAQQVDMSPVLHKIMRALLISVDHNEFAEVAKWCVDYVIDEADKRA